MVRPQKLLEVKGKRNSRTGIRINNTRVRVRNRKMRLTPRQIFFGVLMLFISMWSGIGYVWSNFEGTQIGYDLSLLRQQELRLNELNQKLRLELETLKSPQNLEEASRRFGLRQPLAEQIIILP